MPLFCMKKGDLPWLWSKSQLPLECPHPFRENLDFSTSWKSFQLGKLENTIVFIYFPGKLQQYSLDFFKVLSKLRLICYHSCQFQLGCYKATHHGYHRAILEGSPKWTLFQETSLTFLKSLKIHLFYVLVGGSGSKRENKYPETLDYLELFGQL
jgi:hypothetical protein